jgi:DNA-binding IclR family transcriptional regulator
MMNMTPVLEAVFGSRSAAQVLMFLEAYGSGYAARIASTYDIPDTAAYRQLRRLEASGVLLSRTVGRTRVFEFNMRNPSVRNLREFLAAELELLPDDVVKRYYRQRQRPRRTGKE